MHPWADKTMLASLWEKGEKDAVRGPKGPAEAYPRDRTALLSPRFSNDGIQRLGDPAWGQRTLAIEKGQAGKAYRQGQLQEASA